MTRRLITLSGPSGVGKGPLVAALNTYHPDIRYEAIPIIKSKESRPGGPRPDELAQWDNPAYFRPKVDILALTSDRRYLVGMCRGLPQALDLGQIEDSDASVLFAEVHHSIGAQLRECGSLKGLDIVTLFLSPLGRQEMVDLRRAEVDVVDYLSKVMLHKLMVRAQFQGQTLGASIIADMATRARESPEELRSASHYTHVIVNHDGEGNPNWHRSPEGRFCSPPEGDAARALSSVGNIFRARQDDRAEHWEAPPL